MIGHGLTLKRTRFVYLRDLLRELVARDLKVRYKRSLLGIGWSLITPLLQLVVLSFTFRVVLPLGVENYTLFLFTGLISWTWFQTSLNLSCLSILDNRTLVRQPNFPLSVLPVVTVGSNLVNFLLALLILVPFMLLPGSHVNWTLIFLPAIIAVQFIVIVSLAYFVAVLHVRYRDTQPILTVLLMLGFYLTPVFYPVSKIPEEFQLLYHLNPMVTILTAYRSVLVDGEVPPLASLTIVCLIFCGVLALGYKVFRSASYQFAEEL